MEQNDEEQCWTLIRWWRRRIRFNDRHHCIISLLLLLLLLLLIREFSVDVLRCARVFAVYETHYFRITQPQFYKSRSFSLVFTVNCNSLWSFTADYLTTVHSHTRTHLIIAGRQLLQRRF